MDMKPVIAIGAGAVAVWLYLSGKGSVLLDSFLGSVPALPNTATDSTSSVLPAIPPVFGYGTPSGGGFAPYSYGGGTDANLTIPAGDVNYYNMPLNYNQAPVSIPVTTVAAIPATGGSGGCSGGCG